MDSTQSSPSKSSKSSLDDISDWTWWLSGQITGKIQLQVFYSSIQSSFYSSFQSYFSFSFQFTDHSLCPHLDAEEEDIERIDLGKLRQIEEEERREQNGWACKKIQECKNAWDTRLKAYFGITKIILGRGPVLKKKCPAVLPAWSWKNVQAFGVCQIFLNVGSCMGVQSELSCTKTCAKKFYYLQAISKTLFPPFS